MNEPSGETPGQHDDGRRPDDTTRARNPGATPPFPRYVGPYRIRRVIATGGMGTLYEAIQENPRRVVAVKVIKPGMASIEALRRFRSEPEILARLQHPGILQVFDAGVHDDGAGATPYFVTEYLPRARSITAYADEENLDTTARLELFVKVCTALQHGHQNNVIHRDLKPDNILVDAVGEPKIIDFGVARVTDADLATTTVGTSVGQLVGTIQYMSPEQVEADPRNIDERTDVYSLGVVLYELLVGQQPYRLTGSAIVEAARIIKEESPVRPSTIHRALRGDLETILLKTLSKTRSRRYQSAEALGADIVRFLGDRPIEARPDRFTYRLHKAIDRSVRRRRREWSLAAAVLAVLIARFVGIPLVFEWTGTNRAFERLITQTLAPAPAPGGQLQHVRIVSLTDETDVEALAAAEGLAGVRGDAEHSQTLRRLHGRFMEKLATSGARVVAFDITFSHETEFDADFVRGVRQLEQEGIDVVVSVFNWGLDATGAPEISPVIDPVVRWGGFTANLDPGIPWRLHLTVTRPDQAPMPSLALSTVAAFRHPGARLELGRVNPATLYLRYWKPHETVPGRRVPVAPEDRLRVSTVRPFTEPPTHNLRRGDGMGYYFLEMPAPDTLARSSFDYEAVFKMSPPQMREALAGAVVLIGDYRAGVDRYLHPSGWTYAGTEAHAVGIDRLLNDLPTIRHPRTLAVYGVTIAAALLGLLVGAEWATRHGGRLTVLITIVAAGLAISLGTYRSFDYLFNPLVPMVALVISSELTAWVTRTSRVGA